MKSNEKYIDEELGVLNNCRLCPHECGVNRFKEASGYCRTGAGFYISSIVVHMGEEPVISGTNGICNIFFAHCNLQCKYCQNYQISRNTYVNAGRDRTMDEIIDSIKKILDQGIENIGFVSPSHMVPQLKAIVFRLKREGYHPIIIYNTNAYEKVETLRSLEDIVDVYLPDFKYEDPELAFSWSGVKDYPMIARDAVKEMYRQKGNYLHVNKTGKTEKGLIIRHLVLPGATDNSIRVLKFIAENLSDRIAISLMSQYHPILPVTGNYPLNRKITADEYEEVVKEMNNLGFTKGWIQEPESPDFYIPDFDSPTPFQ